MPTPAPNFVEVVKPFVSSRTDDKTHTFLIFSIIFIGQQGSPNFKQENLKGNYLYGRVIKRKETKVFTILPLYGQFRLGDEMNDMSVKLAFTSPFELAW